MSFFLRNSVLAASSVLVLPLLFAATAPAQTPGQTSGQTPGQNPGQNTPPAAAPPPAPLPSAPLPDSPGTVAAPIVPSGPTVVFDTSLGRMTCKLFSEQSPLATQNFIGLATGTKSFTDPPAASPPGACTFTTEPPSTASFPAS